MEPMDQIKGPVRPHRKPHPRKLTDDQAREVKRLWLDRKKPGHLSVEGIARRFGVSPALINNIGHNRRYRDVFIIEKSADEASRPARAK